MGLVSLHIYYGHSRHESRRAGRRATNEKDAHEQSSVQRNTQAYKNAARKPRFFQTQVLRIVVPRSILFHLHGSKRDSRYNGKCVQRTLKH